MLKHYLNEDWYFSTDFREEMLKDGFDLMGLQKVRIPHTVVETPFHYYDESCYEMVAGYVKEFEVSEEYEGKKIFLTFEGAAHKAIVWVNGVKVGEHSCGYTAFSFDITEQVVYGKSNRVVVSLDSRESLNVPPFGFVIDYQTYGGIYRDVYFEVRETEYIEDVFVKTPNVLASTKELQLEVTCKGESLISKDMHVILFDQNGGIVREQSITKDELAVKWKYLENAQKVQIVLSKLTDISLWGIDTPYLYTVLVELLDKNKVLDQRTVRFGFREVEIREKGFYINGEKIKLRGLNRHQSYPYVGYAMPKGPQQTDAELLKYELGCNAVRTSHYPQSQYFIDRCDEIGLMVFTEMPGWQHIGNEEWKLQAIENVKEMVLQYRNHPSIFLWGVRINESPDDDDFYARTNEAAHLLDSTRQTSGVRCFANSKLLEDVYAYNDFLHDGRNQGTSKKSSISKEPKGYLISEHNGHMFPTKSFDTASHLASQTLRHTKVLNEYYGSDDISACFGWCMFDYNTHKDFGSGDKICYHGVMDMFRNKKPAAYLYESQSDDHDICYITSEMDIGEYPACLMQDVYAVTNADSVRLYKNDVFIREFSKEHTPYEHLPHGPILIDDFIGECMEKQEGYSKKKSEIIKSILMDAGRYGMNHLPISTKLRAARCILFYGMKFQDAVDLYQKYIGNWGGTATVYRFEAVKDGKVVSNIIKAPTAQSFIHVKADRTALVEDYTYDVACVRIEARSENGNVLRFYNDPVELSVEGPIEIIGPRMINLNGGMGGTYVKTLKEAGKAKLIVKDSYGKEQVVEFEIQMR